VVLVVAAGEGSTVEMVFSVGLAQHLVGNISCVLVAESYALLSAWRVSWEEIYC
jgi:hypothetical protein